MFVVVFLIHKMLFVRLDILCIGLAIFCMEEIYFTILVAMVTFFCSIKYFFLFGTCIMGMG